MCGLVAISQLGGNVPPHAFQTAMACIAHRGPDGEGQVFRRNGRLSMGHRRLALFAPGRAGDQPMVAPWGDTIIFNGSLYNYPEVRAELQGLGYPFHSDSDTEVLLAAWHAWGEQALGRFNGTWAFVLHEASSDRLIISRDRLGVRPLYACCAPDRLVLASEVRAVVAAAELPVSINREMAFDFLSLGLTDHHHKTLIDGVVQVPAGALWIQQADGHVEHRQYHHWPDVEPDLTAGQVAARLPALLRQATALRLRAHVPVAAQLSGGVDSGSVAWALGQHDFNGGSTFLGLFGYGYQAGGEAFDEIPRARTTWQKVAPHVPFHEIRVDPTPTMDDLESFLWAQELPVGTPSPLAGLRLYRAMRRAGATVALAGDGSDELFAGYTRRYLPVLLRDALRGGDWRRAKALWGNDELTSAGALARLAWSLPHTMLHLLMDRRPHMMALQDDFRNDLRPRLRSLADHQRQPLSMMRLSDVQGGLLGQVLRYADRNAMAAGMESRSPFLDHRIAELAMRLPMSEKVGPRGGKQPVRLAMASLLPPEVIEGPKNRGLGHAEQFRIGALPLSDVLTDLPRGADEFINAPRLADALRRAPADPRLWWPVCFLLWLRQVEQHWP